MALDLREFLDSILTFIGTESLTDEEFGTVGDIEAEYDKYTYRSLDNVLKDREAVSTVRVKLRRYFLAAGAELSDELVPKPVGSNIFIGRGLG